jgi:trigger factor
METVTNKLEKSMMEVKVTFNGDEWKKAQEQALNKLAKNVKLDGFRKGKAPVQLIKARVGKAAILEDAAESILNKNYVSILVDNGIAPVSQPSVNFDEINEDTLKVTVTCAVVPEVKLGEYKGLEIKKAQVRVTKKEIEERIKNYQEQYAELVVKEDGEVENGDTAVIDFEGFKDGVAFEGGKGENYSLEIGSGSFIPGFEDQLIGMKANEEKEINVTFPENYQAEDLAGAAVVFKVKVHEIKSKVLPEIDDELALDVDIDGVETLEQLQNHVKEQIKTQKQEQAENDFNEKIYTTLIENTPIELPEAMIDNEVDMMVREVEQNLSQQGVNMELYQQITGKTLDDIKADLRPQAEKRVKIDLILSQIAREESLEATQEELDEQIKEIASYYGRKEEEIKQLFAENMDQLKGDIVTKKAVQLVKDNLK